MESRTGAPASDYAETLRQIKAARESDVVEQALSAARERLGMDAAYIATVDSQQQTIEAMVGRTNAEALVEGTVIPVEQTYCARMLKGEIPNIVRDTTAEPALRNMTVIRNIGAYIGVPVQLADGRVHGTLCCASNDPRPALGELSFASCTCWRTSWPRAWSGRMGAWCGWRSASPVRRRVPDRGVVGLRARHAERGNDHDRHDREPDRG